MGVIGRHCALTDRACCPGQQVTDCPGSINTGYARGAWGYGAGRRDNVIVTGQEHQ